MWNTKICILVVFGLMLLAMPIAATAETDSERAREYQIKAAFLYNFTKFVDWQDEKIADANKPIIIGVVSDNPSEQVYEPLEKKKVKGKEIQIRYFRKVVLPSEPEEDSKEEYRRTIQSLKDCHTLFICGPSSQRHINILRVVKKSGVLTIGETSQFVQQGGVVNFVKRKQKIRFEINLAVAQEANLNIRSGLLKLAVMVVGKESGGEK